MQSERRLHPASILFAISAQIRLYAFPAVLVLVGASTRGWEWEIWLLPLMVPALVFAILRYASFRYRYETSEMVVRTGFIFRNERHIPYARIQNLDAVQNVVHRALKVVEVRVETGGGDEPEATMSVLAVADYHDMRRRVFEQRAEAPTEAVSAAAGPAQLVSAASGASAAPSERVLLELPTRELALHGLIQNRGAVMVAAGLGLAWQLGLIDRLMGLAFKDRDVGASAVREFFAAVLEQGQIPVLGIAIGVAALVGFLLLVRLLSMVWALVRLHGFRVTRTGEDLRTEFGLFTRVVATIPFRRIQTVAVVDGPLHRLFRRESVRVQTAGGVGGEESKAQREWIAPILRQADLPEFLREVLPGVDLATLEWQRPAPRAFRRELKATLIVVTPVCLALVGLLRWWGLVFWPILLGWAYLHARLYVAHLAWAMTESAVLFRSGWYRRRLSAARFAKIQAVSLRESPFDRRAAMARVSVDTASAGDSAQAIDIPYLSRETARGLHDVLAAKAEATAFRW